MTSISSDVLTSLAISAETCESNQMHLARKPKDEWTLDDKGLDQLGASYLFLYYHFVLGLDTPEKKAAYKARVVYNARRRVEAPDDENLGDA